MFIDISIESANDSCNGKYISYHTDKGKEVMLWYGCNIGLNKKLYVSSIRYEELLRKIRENNLSIIFS